MEGSLCDSGTVEVIGPIASSVEDAMLVYAAMLGSSPATRIRIFPFTFKEITRKKLHVSKPKSKDFMIILHSFMA
ncbi:hypothetical protein RYX36_000851 [Vicia faba]